MTTAKKTPGKKAPQAPAQSGAAKGRGKTNSKTAANSKTGSTTDAGGKRTRPLPTAAAPKKKKFPVLPVVFGAIALALVAAIVFSPDTEIGSEYGEITVTGDGLPPYISGQEDTAVGTPAPGIDGVDFDGGSVSIASDGVPKAVVFLAHWCPHCQREVPKVQEWLDGGGGVAGVEMVSIATDMNSTRTNYPPSSWLENEGWTPPVIRDTVGNEALQAYGSGGFPYWVFIDADGNVARRSSGELDVSVLESYMQEIAPAT